MRPKLRDSITKAFNALGIMRRWPCLILRFAVSLVPQRFYIALARLLFRVLGTAYRKPKSREDSIKQLKFLFELENRLYTMQGEASIAYGNGIHTKHRHIRYHQFFINNLKPGERVLDIGCGNGIMSYDIVTQVPDVKVVGIELSEANIKFACEHYRHPNLQFIHGDALKLLPREPFDVVTLSNVLEHIEYRVDFLKKIVQQVEPKRLIIRVPLFERDWRVPLKKELGIDYRLDRTHCIEYTQEDFFTELHLSGLKATHTEFRWGEIWSVVEPVSRGVDSND